MIDYTIFYKRELFLNDTWGSDEKWDLFVSAYVPADRTVPVFMKADAVHKRWLLCPEYGYTASDYPHGSVFVDTVKHEAHFVSGFWASLPVNVAQMRICIDISGFIRPYLMFLVRWMFEKGVRTFDAIYTEPIQYKKRELTEFSGNVVTEVRQIAGFEGVHVPDISKDVLIIGAGYEDNLISQVADNKAKAQKLQLYGFPSLRADMYQENVLRVRRAEEALGGRVDDEILSFFAPVNDPFVAATELSRIVEEQRARSGLTNLYLCPVSKKAHVLGFTLYYLTECRGTPTSMIFPFEERYSQETSRGVARIWKYTVELPTT